MWALMRVSSNSWEFSTAPMACSTNILKILTSSSLIGFWVTQLSTMIIASGLSFIHREEIKNSFNCSWVMIPLFLNFSNFSPLIWSGLFSINTSKSMPLSLDRGKESDSTNSMNFGFILSSLTRR